MDRTANLVNLLHRIFPVLLPDEVFVQHDDTPEIRTAIRAIHEEICITCYLFDDKMAVSIKYEPNRTEYAELTFFSVPETEEGFARVIERANNLLDGITDELVSLTGSWK